MANRLLPEVFGRGTTDLFGSLQREIDQVFRDFGRGLPAWGRGTELPDVMALKLNVAETDKAIEVTADLPGMDAKDIDIQLRDGVLTIKGEKKFETEEKEKDFHLVERSYGSFERSFELPADVEVDKVEAAFDKGVLKVTLPKLPEVAARAQKIEVKPAA